MNKMRAKPKNQRANETVMKAVKEEKYTPEKPTVTQLDDKDLKLKEEHMEEVISKGVNVFNKGSNGMPDPEKDPKDDDKESKTNKTKMQEAMNEIKKGLIDKD